MGFGEKSEARAKPDTEMIKKTSLETLIVESTYRSIMILVVKEVVKATDDSRKRKGGRVVPICENCGKEWSWQLTLRKLFTLDNHMKCLFCESKQYQTKRSKKRTAACSFVIPFMIPLLIMFNVSFLFSLLLFVGLFLFLIGLMPFLIELSNTEEFMW